MSSVESVQRLYPENQNASHSACVKSLKRDCRQMDQSNSETVLRQVTLAETWEVEESPMHSNAKLVVKKATASEDSSC
jgi:hypothetical protein